MKTGQCWSCWKFAQACLLPVALLLHLTGCAKDRVIVEKNLMATRHAQRHEGVAAAYRVGCPDVVEIQVQQREEFSGHYSIGPDGKINLGEYGNLRIEGHTPAEIAPLLAAATGVSADQVQVRVSDFHQAYVLLFGEVSGRQRSIPYQGQETVLDLLQRVGGITVGAEPKDVYVVRPHLGDSQRPEVFHVDLQAIVVKHDDRTNLRILPYDQIYVGETHQAKVEKALPPWLRRMYQAVWDTHRNSSLSRSVSDPVANKSD